MDYIVTSIQKSDKGRVSLCINHKISFWLYGGEVKRYGLQEGSQIPEEEYQDIVHGLLGRRASKRAMHLLERQEKTEYQLREKLKQGGYPSEAIEDAIDYVKQYHYLDDERYARTFILFHQEKRSRLRLKMDLQRRGIDREVIQAALEDIYVSDEREQIKELLEKRGFSGGMDDEKEYGRNYRFLMRRGFQSSDINQVMEEMAKFCFV